MTFRKDLSNCVKCYVQDLSEADTFYTGNYGNQSLYRIESRTTYGTIIAVSARGNTRKELSPGDTVYRTPRLIDL